MSKLSKMDKLAKILATMMERTEADRVRDEERREREAREQVNRELKREEEQERREEERARREERRAKETRDMIQAHSQWCPRLCSLRSLSYQNCQRGKT